MKEIVEESKIYTVYTVTGVDEEHEIMSHPHNPRKNLAGTKGIATGIFTNVPDAEHLTQEEAELRMATGEWTSEEA